MTHAKLLLPLAVLASALASTPSAAAAPTPAFAELPIGRVTAPPTKAPGFVSARESVPGVHVVVPKLSPYVAVTGDARIATAMKNGTGHDPSFEFPSACVAQDDARRRFDGLDEPRESEWSETLGREQQVYRRSADNPRGGVAAIHTERLVDLNGTMTLESVDAWVDPTTRGAKLIGRASLPLKLVSTPQFGLKVYAGRDERPNGKRFVQVVVLRERGTDGDRLGHMWSRRGDGDVSHSSGCAHVRVALPLEGKNGDLAIVVAPVILPELAGKTDKPSSSKPPSPKIAALFGNRPPTGDESEEREIRTRIMHIQASVSQTTREKDPLVSISASWGAREQVERVPVSAARF